MKIKNYTPHDIKIIINGEEDITIPSKGVARVEQTEEIVGRIIVDGKEIPIVQVRYGSVDGLPTEPEENTQYIVSVFVAQALRGNDVWKGHLLVPNSGPTPLGAVRDEKGRIVGVRSLIRP